jgi:transcriptional regulator with PAS, ATPase and Fis domain
VVHPPALRASAELGAENLVIGRHASQSIHSMTIGHQTISRAHLSLAWDPSAGAHVATDLRSHNGSFVNGSRLDGARVLEDGALLRLGDVLIVYERTDRSVALARGVSTEAVPGRAWSLEALRSALVAAAADLAPALVQGESGTGKERVARELHRLSGRRGPFVAVNCAALSPQLIEAQLFGHARGAYTGATEAQPGLFRAAAGGSLLLDEIGELPLALQPKLLRAVETGEVLAVGATKALTADVRVIAATHRDVASAVASGAFREDLYGRLSLRELSVPPLRARRVDVLDWLDRLAGRSVELDADAAELLLLHRWPMNLRAVDRLVRSLREGLVCVADLPRWITDGDERDEGPRDDEPAVRAAPSRDEFVRAWDEHRGNVSALARVFERDRRQIYRWADAYGLRAR